MGWPGRTIFPALPGGWRRTAILNIWGVAALLITILCFIIAVVANSSDWRRAVILYTADCRSGDTTRMNVALHLLLNAISTAILASSNFFMQILNAPSRGEVDAAHAKADWLDIGVPSWRNAFRLSRFKSISWVILFLSSIPIHLLFNSTIFEIDRREGDFHLTIAADSFAKGGAYCLPGASLFSGARLLGYTWEGTLYDQTGDARPPTLAEYSGSEAPAAHNISKAASNASGWTRLDAASCMAQYVDCQGLRDYRNVVMVVDEPDWTRSAVWNLTEDVEAFWEPRIPKDAQNSLWFSSQCRMFARIKSGARPGCSTTCDLVTDDESSTDSSFTVRPFSNEWSDTFVTWQTPLWPPWNGYFSESDRVGNFSSYASRAGLRPQGESLSISHCLAEPRDAVLCHVGLSTPLLLAVLVPALVKLVTCVVAVVVLGPQESLVTQGDAIASFISDPDPTTARVGIVDQLLILKATCDPDFKLAGPRQFSLHPERRASAVPRRTWYTTFAILILGVSLAGGMLGIELSANGKLDAVKLGESGSGMTLSGLVGDLPFISSVVVANSPQIAFALFYFAYNTMLTRLESCQEWALFSTSYRPLRVTRPKGRQRETYWLNLPYKYSISLIILSIVMHWVLSNCLYVVVAQGSYYPPGEGYSGGYNADPISLPNGAVVVLGASSGSLLLLLVLGLIMIPVPWCLGRLRLPGHMPLVGTSSLALSAACQVSPLSKVPSFTLGAKDKDKNKDEVAVISDGDSSAMELLSMSETDSSLEDSRSRGGDDCDGVDLLKMSRSLLTWGVVKMPPAWHDEERRLRCGGAEEPVDHMSFGTLLDDVRQPVGGHLYA